MIVNCILHPTNKPHLTVIPKNNCTKYLYLEYIIFLEADDGFINAT